jgi:hypothetical protein
MKNWFQAFAFKWVNLYRYSAVHCDWHDGMKIALLYRAIGAMAMKNKGKGPKGGREVHVPHMEMGIEVGGLYKLIAVYP